MRRDARTGWRRASVCDPSVGLRRARRGCDLPSFFPLQRRRGCDPLAQRGDLVRQPRRGRLVARARVAERGDLGLGALEGELALFEKRVGPLALRRALDARALGHLAALALALELGRELRDALLGGLSARDAALEAKGCNDLSSCLLDMTGSKEHFAGWSLWHSHEISGKSSWPAQCEGTFISSRWSGRN